MPKQASRWLKRPRTEKQMALAEVRRRDNETLEKRYGRRFQAKAFERFEKLIPEAKKLKYGSIWMLAYTLAVCIDNRRNNTQATDAVGRARDRDMAEMRKMRAAEGRKKVAHA